MAQRTNGNKIPAASRRRRLENGDEEAWGPWAYLNPDLLLLIFMKLGLIDLLSFSGVCREWRAFSLLHREKFLDSKEPLLLIISQHARRGCRLLNSLDGRRFKTLLPNFSGKHCVGTSCGYLIMMKKKPTTFWLFNLITRHELHFPPLPANLNLNLPDFRAVLVYSTFLSDFILVVLDRKMKCILFSQPGDAAKWQFLCYSETDLCFVDLHAYEGKLYGLNVDGQVGEMRLNPVPTITVLNIKNKPSLLCQSLQFLSSSEKKLFMVDMHMPRLLFAFELDLTKLEWVERENLEEYAFFMGDLKSCAAINPTETRLANAAFVITHPGFSQRRRWVCAQYHIRRSSQALFLTVLPNINARMWYFPHECYRTNILDDGP